MKLAIVMLVLALAAARAEAAQFVEWNGEEVHYLVVNTMALDAEIARRYDIVRARNRAIVNVSVVRAPGVGRAVRITGETVNLLGQLTPLSFREVREGEAIYYLAPIEFTDQEVLEFRLRLAADEASEFAFEFSERMFLAP